MSDHPIVPHGMSVFLNAPAAFRFTGPACPDRHLKAATLLGADISEVRDPEAEAGAILADRIVALMKRLEMPNGLSAIGFTEGDVPALVEGTMPQHRVDQAVAEARQRSGPGSAVQGVADSVVAAKRRTQRLPACDCHGGLRSVT